jgi:hypothetical protein
MGRGVFFCLGQEREKQELLISKENDGDSSLPDGFVEKNKIQREKHRRLFNGRNS